MKVKKPIPVNVVKKIVSEWRKWHKPDQGGFPSEGLIDSLHKLDIYFSGKTAGEICEENNK